jgi:hypothetical protein
MAYMLLVVEQRGQRATRSMDQGKDVYQRMLDYTESLKAKGMLIASDSLRSDAVRLSVRAGKSRVIDGPFTEAKEIIGGFFLVNCATRDEAHGIASACPAAEWATIEVRPVGPCYE